MMKYYNQSLLKIIKRNCNNQESLKFNLIFLQILIILIKYLYKVIKNLKMVNSL